MAFLTLNDIEIPIQMDSVSVQFEEIGSVQRSMLQKIQDTRRGKRRKWTMKTVPLGHRTCMAMHYFIQGVGHYFSFDEGLGSATGLQANSYQCQLQSTYGGSLYIDGATSDFIEIPAKLGDQWTLFWRDYTSGLGRSEMLLRSDGLILSNGGGAGFSYQDARSVESIYKADVTVDSAGTVRIESRDTTELTISDLAIYPYFMSDRLANQVCGVGSTGGGSDLPTLTMGGEIIGSVTTSVVGEVSTSPYIAHGPNAWADGYGVDITPGDWVDNDQVIEFTLYETDAAFNIGGL